MGTITKQPTIAADEQRFIRRVASAVTLAAQTNAKPVQKVQLTRLLGFVAALVVFVALFVLGGVVAVLIQHSLIGPPVPGPVMAWPIVGVIVASGYASWTTYRFVKRRMMGDAASSTTRISDNGEPPRMRYLVVIAATVGGMVVGAIAATMFINTDTTYQECLLKQMRGQDQSMLPAAGAVCRKRHDK
jgi:hypothetical protein